MALTKVTGQVIKNTTDVTVGVLTVTNTLAVGGTVSIGGTLTYEDVTNVDAVGLITARNGIVVGSGITLSKDGDIFATGITTVSGNVKVGTGITLSPDGDGFFTGVITATSYSGIDLSDVTGATGDFSIADKIVHTGDTNTALRFPAADTVTVETAGSERLRINSSGQLGLGASNNSDYDASAQNLLIASSGTTGITLRSGGSSHYGAIHFADGTSSSAEYRAGRILYEHSSDSLLFYNANTFAVKIDGSGNMGIGENSPSNLLHVKVSDTGITPHASAQIVLERSGTNYLQFLTAADGTSGVLFGDASDNDVAQIKYDHNVPAMQFLTETGERMRIDSSGNVDIKTGNLVIGTAGKGIDFSAQTATSASGASTSSELLDHYEEGTWTPVYVSTNSTISYDTQTGYFTRVGNTVTVTAYIRTSSVSSTGHSLVKVSGLPFAEGKNQRTPGSVRCNGFQGTATDFGYPVTWSVEAGQTFGELQRYQSGGNGDFTTSTMNNATYVYLQCTYQVA